jgi:DNA-binding transcriptional regulator YhcF (GntR family)
MEEKNTLKTTQKHPTPSVREMAKDLGLSYNYCNNKLKKKGTYLKWKKLQEKKKEEEKEKQLKVIALTHLEKEAGKIAKDFLDDKEAKDKLKKYLLNSVVKELEELSSINAGQLDSLEAKLNAKYRLFDMLLKAGK